MDIIIILAVIAAGIILFLVEVFLIPGISIAGIVSAGCLVYANYHAFSTLGTTGGLITLILSISSYIVLFIWFVRSKSIDKLALSKDIDSTVGTPAQQQVSVGDKGVALTRLALIGNAEINGQIIEVKSSDGFLNEHTPIVVDRIMEGVILVRRQ